MSRAVYVCTDPGVPVFGRKGASVHVQSVLRALVAAGWQVDLVTPRPGGEAPEDLTGVVVHVLGVEDSATASDRELALQRADARVAAVLDRVHEDGPLDLVYERYSLWGVTATAWSAAHDVPSVLEVNAPLVEEQARHRVLVDAVSAEAAARKAISAAGTCVCVSEAVARWARARCTDPGRVHVLSNGVDTARVTPALPGTGRDSSDDFVVGFVGTLKPWHGVEHLLDAVAPLVDGDRSWRVLLVGDGPQAQALREQADRLGLGQAVEVTGAVDPQDVPGLLHRMDVAVAPYPALSDFYFSPLKVYEYMAAGLPVVASAVGELPAALDHGRLGVLVPPGDPEALRSALVGLRADPGRREDLGREARAEAVRAHDWSVVVGRALGWAETDQRIARQTGEWIGQEVRHGA